MSLLLVQADARHLPFAAGSAQTCITSPPYWGLRDYGIGGQLGLEPTPDAYVQGMVAVFREVWRVLRDDGTCWLNLGDSYANKQLVGIPWRVALALQADGWLLRSEIVWSKPNAMPESVTDRPTRAHEQVFLLSRSSSYSYDADAVREAYSPMTIDTPQRRRMIAAAKFSGEHEFRFRKAGETCAYCNGSGEAYDPPDQSDAKCGGCGGSGLIVRATGERMLRLNEKGRNVRSVWQIRTQPFGGAHFARFPEKLVERCVLAGSKPGDVVLDPFMGSGTVARVALKLGRKAIGCDLNPAYLKLADGRTRVTYGLPLDAPDTDTEVA